MTKLEKDAALAGELTKKHEGWTDKELRLIIRIEKIALAFLENKGPEWGLVTSPLGSELRTFKGFVEARKEDRR